VYAIERSAAFATGFPAALVDADITTPFARPLADIASVSDTQTPKEHCLALCALLHGLDKR
jgi:hypothetical protein